MSEGPYRGGGGGAPRYVCLACYKYASQASGLCPTCGIDLLSLDKEEVRADLRAEAERRMQSRQYAEYFGLHLVAFLVMSPILIPSVGFILSNAAYIFASLGLGWLARVGYARIRPSSALALYAKRNRRLQASLTSAAPPQLPAHQDRSRAPVEEGQGDPEEMSLEETMRWLGMPSDAPHGAHKK